MKIILSLFTIIVLTNMLSAFGQDVSIYTRKVVYHRPHAASPEKAKVVVEYPRVKARNRYLARTIERSIGFASVMVNDPAQDIVRADQWLESAGYRVDYNKDGILGVTLWKSGSGHFESTFYKSVVIDLRSGKRVKIRRIIRDIPGLRALVSQKMRDEIAEAVVEGPKMEAYTGFDHAKWMSDAEITDSDLEEFTISHDGITFRHDYSFPRIVRDLQPAGIFLIRWSEIKPFIRRPGLLEKFVS